VVTLLASRPAVQFLTSLFDPSTHPSLIIRPLDLCIRVLAPGAREELKVAAQRGSKLGRGPRC
jgi:hypothetical protein